MVPNLSKVWEKIDGAIQKIVDAIAFFCMRHFGMTKGYLRFACMAATASISAAMYISDREFSHVVGFCLNGTIAIFSHRLESMHNPDAGVDLQRDGPLRVMSLLVLFEDILEAIGRFSIPAVDARDYEKRFDAVEMLLIGIIFVFLVYINRTPKKPPPKKRRAESKVSASVLANQTI